MSTVQELIKEKQQRQLKTEISYIKAAVISTMSYLDMADNEETTELYSKLDNVILEIIKLENKPEYNSSIF
jgi:hypothetical protein